MALKAKYGAEDQIPTGLEDYYTEQDGEYVLVVDGMVDKNVVSEFRQNNINLQKQLAGLEKQMGAVDVDEYKALKAQQQKVADQELIDAGKVDELVNTRVERMQSQFEQNMTQLQGKLEETTQAANKYRENYDTLIVERTLADAAARAGVRSEAIPDVLNRARAVWSKADDDSLVAVRGDQPVYGKNGSTPISIDEWYEGLSDEAPHLFKASEGSGALGGRGSASRRVSVYDTDALSDNLENIASGKVAVTN